MEQVFDLYSRAINNTQTNTKQYDEFARRAASSGPSIHFNTTNSNFETNILPINSHTEINYFLLKGLGAVLGFCSVVVASTLSRPPDVFFSDS